MYFLDAHLMSFANGISRLATGESERAEVVSLDHNRRMSIAQDDLWEVWPRGLWIIRSGTAC